MSFFLRWTCLLGIALLGPVALPAGGADLNSKNILLRKDSSILISTEDFPLFTSPCAQAPCLAKLSLGTPLRILRGFRDINGLNWLQVKVSSLDICEFESSAKRGWIVSSIDRMV